MTDGATILIILSFAGFCGCLVLHVILRICVLSKPVKPRQYQQNRPREQSQSARPQANNHRALANFNEGYNQTHTSGGDGYAPIQFPDVFVINMEPPAYHDVAKMLPKYEEAVSSHNDDTNVDQPSTTL